MKKIAEYDENRVIPMTPRRNDLVVKKLKIVGVGVHLGFVQEKCFCTEKILICTFLQQSVN